MNKNLIAVNPYISIVVPVFQEEENLATFFERLISVLENNKESYEVIFIDDGSTDKSLQILKEFCEKNSSVKVIEFSRNFGQHSAIFAGFEEAKGEVIITLDADLQNPPEEILKLLEKIKEGYDVVGGWRKKRKDTFYRRITTSIINKVNSRMVGVQLNDYGCMLRAYKKDVVESMCKCNELSTYIPALANSFAKKVAEVEVEHSERKAGKSKYNLFKLIRLNFDLITGFSILPIQIISLLGFLVAVIGVLFGLFLLIRRIFIGPEVEGVFTLFAILFVFVGMQILALGLIGEYVGRIYAEVRKRPRFIIKNIYGDRQ